MTTTAFYSPPLSSIGGSVQAPTYVVFQIGGVTYAQSSAGSGFQAYSGTDAATVINNAIAALATNGGTIFIRAGTYTLNSQIAIDHNNIHLIGEGVGATTLQGSTKLNTVTTPAFDMVSVASSSAVSNVSVESMTLDGSLASPANLFYVLGINDNGGLYACDRVYFINLKVIPFTNGAAVTGAVSANDGGSAHPNTDILLYKVKVDATGITMATVVYGFGIFSDTLLVDCTCLNWKQGSLANQTDFGFYLSPTNTITMLGGSATSCETGIEAVATTNGGLVTLVGVTVTKCLKNGIITAGGALEATIDGCTSTNNGQDGTQSYANRSGIYVNLAAPTNIHGCDLRDTQSTHTQAYGAWIQGGSAQGMCSISDCDMSGNIQSVPIGVNFHVNPTGSSGSINANNYVSIRNIRGFTPVNKVSLPLLNDATNGNAILPTVSGLTAVAVPSASTDYMAMYVPALVTSVGGTGVSISIKDNAGNNIQTGLTTLTQQYIPNGYRVNWGGFSAGPTVTVWGLGQD